MKVNRLSLAAMFTAAMLVAACSTTPDTQSGRDTLNTNANSAFQSLKQTDPSLNDFLTNSAGYAVFPTIGKGGAGLGGAFGHGELFSKDGSMLGYTDMTQATIGAQLGAQSYAELIVFQNDASLQSFKNGSLAFDANASAVAASAGAAATAKYTNGVAVFVKTNGGLMAEADIGGQKFNFVPMTQVAPQQ